MNIKRIKPYIIAIIPIAIILFSTLINSFPSGYIYTSGDFAQPINMTWVFNQMFYVWGDKLSATGEGGFQSWFAAIPYYFIHYMVPEAIGMQSSQILSYTFLLFMLMAYFSFYFATKTLFKKSNTSILKIYSLLYSFNLTTLYFFTYTWGFSHQVFLYLTIPILVAFFYKYIKKPSVKSLAMFILSFTLSGSGFTNPAFFAAIFLYLFLFMLFLIILKELQFNQKLVFSIIILCIFSILSIAYWLLPTATFALDGLRSISEGKVFDITNWVKGQSSDITSILLGYKNYSDYFPFKYNSKLFYSLGFIPSILLIFLMGKYKKQAFKGINFAIALIATGVIFILLIKKYAPPFSELTLLLYKLPAISIFRSYEKLAIFLPFTIFTGIWVFLITKAYPRKIIIIVLMLLTPFPFFSGGIQKKYSITFPANQNYISAKYSSLISIPQDYYVISSILNENENTLKIQALPYSTINSIAWVNYPKWKLIGLNPTDNLFRSPVISQNASMYLLHDWNPSLEFNVSKIDPVWYIKLISMFGVSDIIFHNDVADDFISQSINKIENLEQRGIIFKGYTSQSATIYNINTDYVTKNIYIPDNNFSIYGPLKFLPHALMFNNHKNNFRFSLNTLPADPTADIYIFEQPIESLYTLDAKYWKASWAWPDGKQIDPYSISYKLLRLKENLFNDYIENKNEKITNSLIELARLAIIINNQNLYSDPNLEKQFSDDAIKLLQILSHDEQSVSNSDDIKNIAKAISYFQRIKSIYTSNLNNQDRFLETLYNLYIKVSGCDEHHQYCYSLKPPIGGQYEIYIPKSEVGIYDDKDIANNLQLRLAFHNNNKVIATPKESEDENYIYFGTYQLDQDSAANVDLEIQNNKNLISNGDWVEYRAFESTNDNLTITPQVLNMVELRYKQIENWEPNVEYIITFDYKFKSGKITYSVIETYESSKDFEKINYAEKHILLSESLNNTDRENRKDPVTWKTYEKRFTTSNLSKNGFLFLSGSTNSDFVDLQIKNLSVKRIVNPLIIAVNRKDSKEEDITKPQILYTKLSPTKYLVAVNNADSDYQLVLSESFNSGWKLREKYSNENTFSVIKAFLANRYVGIHNESNGYSNSWYIKKSDFNNKPEYEMIVEFTPQALLYLGTLSTIITFIVSITILIFKNEKINRI